MTGLEKSFLRSIRNSGLKKIKYRVEKGHMGEPAVSVEYQTKRGRIRAGLISWKGSLHASTHRNLVQFG